MHLHSAENYLIMFSKMLLIKTFVFLDAIASLDSVLSVSWLVGWKVGWLVGLLKFLKSRVWRSNSRFIMIQIYPTMMKFI